jgi:hypothetical protein
MPFRAFEIAAWSSAFLLACSVISWLCTFALNPWDHRFSLTNAFHVSVWDGPEYPVVGSLVFFNNREYGPYRGSLIGISDTDGTSVPVLDRKVAWGRSYGVYYRYFRWPEGHVLWTLMVSLWYPIILFSLLPAIWFWRRHAHLKVAQQRTKPQSSASLPNRLNVF